MVDIYLMHMVAKAILIKGLSSVVQCHWKALFLKMMSVKDTMLNKSLDCTFSRKCAVKRYTNLFPPELIISKDTVN